MAISIDREQIVSFQELLMPQVLQQEALTRLLLGKNIYLIYGKNRALLS